MQTPKGTAAKILYYSAYKKGYTLKSIVFGAPHGHIMHITPFYGGRATDYQMSVESNIIQKFDPGDECMAGKMSF